MYLMSVFESLVKQHRFLAVRNEAKEEVTECRHHLGQIIADTIHETEIRTFSKLLILLYVQTVLLL